MMIREIQCYAVHLPMIQNFAISGGTVGDAAKGAPHVYVKVVDESGKTGWGEARPSHRWSYETQESVMTTIENYLRPALIGSETGDLQGIHRIMSKQIVGGFGSGQPIAKAAVDMALHDLIGKQSSKSLPQLWLSSANSNIRLSYLISTMDPGEAAVKARFAVQQGYRALDIKIGIDPSRDIGILEAVRAEAPDLFLRVDANQAYDLPRAIRLARHMEGIGIDVFEQPLAAANLLGHAELRRKTSVPIALDESIWTPTDMLQAIRLEALDIAVIKIAKMGGLRGAKLCGEIAAESGLGLLGGGLTESRLGLAASAHLFNYLNISVPVDLNGPLFLSDDPLLIGPEIMGEQVRLPEGPGTGCMMNEEKLAGFAREFI